MENSLLFLNLPLHQNLEKIIVIGRAFIWKRVSSFLALWFTKCFNEIAKGDVIGAKSPTLRIDYGELEKQLSSSMHYNFSSV